MHLPTIGTYKKRPEIREWYFVKYIFGKKRVIYAPFLGPINMVKIPLHECGYFCTYTSVDYSLPHLNRAGTINVSRPVFYTPKYIESNGILSNYMVIYRVDPIMTI